MLNPLSDARHGLGTALKLLMSALTLVAALAWNEAIKTLFEIFKKFFPSSGGDWAQFLAQLIYAVIVTLVTVYVIQRLEPLKKIFEEEVLSETENKTED